MSKTPKPTGGPAFPGISGTEGYGDTIPVTLPNGERGWQIMSAGMTLRDYFAAKAMAAIIVGNSADSSVTDVHGAIGAAKDAYIVADAMLAARDA